LPKSLGPALVELAAGLLEPRLGDAGAADLFLARHPGEAAVTALVGAWEAAAPAAAAGPQADEVTTLAVSPGPAVDPLVEQARQTLGAGVRTAAGVDEVALVREAAGLPVAGLPQAGPAAKAAYQRRKSAGDSPHARIDVLVGVD
jgi:hypothetical protein